MQGLTLAAIIAIEKPTLMLDSTSAKSMSREPGHSAYLKSMSRTITIRGLTLAAISAAEKRTLMLDST